MTEDKWHYYVKVTLDGKNTPISYYRQNSVAEDIWSEKNNKWKPTTWLTHHLIRGESNIEELESEPTLDELKALNEPYKV